MLISVTMTTAITIYNYIVLALFLASNLGYLFLITIPEIGSEELCQVVAVV